MLNEIYFVQELQFHFCKIVPYPLIIKLWIVVC